MSSELMTSDLMTLILALVGEQLGQAEITARDRLLEDLGAESFDILNIVAAVEDRLGIFLEEEEIPSIRDAADLFSLVQEKLHREGGKD